MMKIIPGLLLLLFFTACTRPADVKIRPHSPVLVLHGLIATGETFRVSIGRTLPLGEPFSDSSHVVRNAWVLLFADNVFADSLVYDPADRLYKSSVTAQAGQLYRVVAGAAGFPVVEAEARASVTVETELVDYAPHAGMLPDGRWLNDIRFRFTDPPGVNYYLVEIRTASGGIHCLYSFDPAIERFTGISIGAEPGACLPNDQVIFSDRSFNGGMKEMLLSAETENMQPVTDPVSGRIIRPVLIKKNVSADHYHYFRNSISLMSSDPVLSTPASISTNVRNGYGLLSVFHMTTDTLP